MDGGTTMLKRIMTVEDSTSLRQMVSFTLQDAGYDVVEAKDGQDALDKLAISGVDMILTDMNMPNMNGVELTESIRLNPAYRFIPVVFLTTESQMQKKQAAKNAGATGWIVKPFKPEQLVGVVKKVLG